MSEGGSLKRFWLLGLGVRVGSLGLRAEGLWGPGFWGFGVPNVADAL